MKIVKNKKKIDAIEVFPNINDFKIFSVESNKINLESSVIREKCDYVYDLLINGDGKVLFSRLSRWNFSKFGFKNRTVFSISFWAERGYSEYESKIKIREIFSKNKGDTDLKKQKYADMIKNLKKISYKGYIFNDNTNRMCSCSKPLIIKSTTINNELVGKIIGCSNKNCNTYKLSLIEKYKLYLPENIYIEVIKKKQKINKENSIISINYYIKRGFSEDFAKAKISEIQKNRSKKVKEHKGKSKKNLRLKGYSENKINELCLTPANIKFWLNKGYSDDEAKIKLIENQSYASKHVDYTKRLLPSNIEYWTNKGFSKEEAKIKVSEHQRTFTLEKCIEKHGDEKGRLVFTERQIKWSKSLSSGGNLKLGYSKISQDLFYSLLNHYMIKDRENVYFATKNKEFRLPKKNGGIYIYDFTDTKNKKIIEFNGDMFHGNPEKYKYDDFPNPFKKILTAKEIWDYDIDKEKIANKDGFDLLVVWESEYRKNKELVIKKCLDFLEISK